MERIDAILNYGLKPGIPSASVGIWGSKQAGKTTYLAMLRHAMNDSDWSMKACDRESQTFLEKAYHTIFVNGTFPDPTRVEAARVYSYWFQRPRSYFEKVAGSRKTFRVEFVDASGEWFEGTGLGSATYGWDDPYSYLAECQGIVCLLDPIRMAREGEAYANLVADALQQVQQHMSLDRKAKLPHYVAFALSKADEDEYWSDRTKPESIIKKLVGRNGLNLIKRHCHWRRRQFFAFSAIGRVQGKPNYEMHNGRIRIKNRDNIESFHLFDPLKWILEKL